MTFVDFAAAQLRKFAEAANQDEPGVWYSDPNMLAMRTSIPCVDADFICACTPTRIIALLDALAHASPPPAPKVGDGFVSLPREPTDKICRLLAVCKPDIVYETWAAICATAPAPVVAEAQSFDPEGIDADLEQHTSRASAEEEAAVAAALADAAPERDPRNEV